MKMNNNELNIIKMENQGCIMTYLQFLQNVISRMANNSSQIKVLITAIYTIFTTILVGINKFKEYWWIGLIITFIGMIMDAYYLALERMYRDKYNDFVNGLKEDKINVKEIFNMNPKSTKLRFEIFAVMIESFNSFSICGFYILFIVITILLKII